MKIRNTETQVKTASGMNALLGAWLVLSPWIFQYAPFAMGAFWNSVIIGAVVSLFGISRARAPRERPILSWMNMVMGALTAFAPWTFGYVDDTAQMWNSVLVGIAIFGLAIWSGSATAAYRRHAHA
jgi:cyanate permease